MEFWILDLIWYDRLLIQSLYICSHVIASNDLASVSDFWIYLTELKDFSLLSNENVRGYKNLDVSYNVVFNVLNYFSQTDYSREFSAGMIQLKFADYKIGLLEPNSILGYVKTSKGKDALLEYSLLWPEYYPYKFTFLSTNYTNLIFNGFLNLLNIEYTYKLKMFGKFLVICYVLSIWFTFFYSYLKLKSIIVIHLYEILKLSLRGGQRLPYGQKRNSLNEDYNKLLQNTNWKSIYGKYKNNSRESFETFYTSKGPINNKFFDVLNLKVNNRFENESIKNFKFNKGIDLLSYLEERDNVLNWGITNLSDMERYTKFESYWFNSYGLGLGQEFGGTGLSTTNLLNGDFWWDVKDPIKRRYKDTSVFYSRLFYDLRHLLQVSRIYTIYIYNNTFPYWWAKKDSLNADTAYMTHLFKMRLFNSVMYTTQWAMWDGSIYLNEYTYDYILLLLRRRFISSNGLKFELFTDKNKKINYDSFGRFIIVSPSLVEEFTVIMERLLNILKSEPTSVWVFDFIYDLMKREDYKGFYFKPPFASVKRKLKWQQVNSDFGIWGRQDLNTSQVYKSVKDFYQIDGKDLKIDKNLTKFLTLQNYWDYLPVLGGRQRRSDISYIMSGMLKFKQKKFMDMRLLEHLQDLSKMEKQKYYLKDDLWLSDFLNVYELQKSSNITYNYRKFKEISINVVNTFKLSKLPFFNLSNVFFYFLKIHYIDLLYWTKNIISFILDLINYKSNYTKNVNPWRTEFAFIVFLCLTVFVLPLIFLFFLAVIMIFLKSYNSVVLYTPNISALFVKHMEVIDDSVYLKLLNDYKIWDFNISDTSKYPIMYLWENVLVKFLNFNVESNSDYFYVNSFMSSFSGYNKSNKYLAESFKHWDFVVQRYMHEHLTNRTAILFTRDVGTHRANRIGIFNEYVPLRLLKYRLSGEATKTGVLSTMGMLHWVRYVRDLNYPDMSFQGYKIRDNAYSIMWPFWIGYKNNTLINQLIEMNSFLPKFVWKRDLPYDINKRPVAYIRDAYSILGLPDNPLFFKDQNDESLFKNWLGGYGARMFSGSIYNEMLMDKYNIDELKKVKLWTYDKDFGFSTRNLRSYPLEIQFGPNLVEYFRLKLLEDRTFQSMIYTKQSDDWPSLYGWPIKEERKYLFGIKGTKRKPYQNIYTEMDFMDFKEKVFIGKENFQVLNSWLLAKDKDFNQIQLNDLYNPEGAKGSKLTRLWARRLRSVKNGSLSTHDYTLLYKKWANILHDKDVDYRDIFKGEHYWSRSKWFRIKPKTSKQFQSPASWSIPIWHWHYKHFERKMEWLSTYNYIYRSNLDREPYGLAVLSRSGELPKKSKVLWEKHNIENFFKPQSNLIAKLYNFYYKARFWNIYELEMEDWENWYWKNSKYYLYKPKNLQNLGGVIRALLKNQSLGEKIALLNQIKVNNLGDRVIENQVDGLDIFTKLLNKIVFHNNVDVLGVKGRYLSINLIFKDFFDVKQFAGEVTYRTMYNWNHAILKEYAFRNVWGNADYTSLWGWNIFGIGSKPSVMLYPETHHGWVNEKFIHHGGYQKLIVNDWSNSLVELQNLQRDSIPRPLVYLQNKLFANNVAFYDVYMLKAGKNTLNNTKTMLNSQVLWKDYYIYKIFNYMDMWSLKYMEEDLIFRYFIIMRYKAEVDCTDFNRYRLRYFDRDTAYLKDLVWYSTSKRNHKFYLNDWSVSKLFKTLNIWVYLKRIYFDGGDFSLESNRLPSFFKVVKKWLIYIVRFSMYQFRLFDPNPFLSFKGGYFSFRNFKLVEERSFLIYFYEILFRYFVVIYLDFIKVFDLSKVYEFNNTLYAPGYLNLLNDPRNIDSFLDYKEGRIFSLMHLLFFVGYIYMVVSLLYKIVFNILFYALLVFKWTVNYLTHCYRRETWKPEDLEVIYTVFENINMMSKPYDIALEYYGVLGFEKRYDRQYRTERKYIPELEELKKSIKQHRAYSGRYSLKSQDFFWDRNYGTHYVDGVKGLENAIRVKILSGEITTILWLFRLYRKLGKMLILINEADSYVNYNKSIIEEYDFKSSKLNNSSKIELYKNIIFKLLHARLRMEYTKKRMKALDYVGREWLDFVLYPQVLKDKYTQEKPQDPFRRAVWESEKMELEMWMKELKKGLKRSKKKEIKGFYESVVDNEWADYFYNTGWENIKSEKHNSVINMLKAHFKDFGMVDMTYYSHMELFMDEELEVLEVLEALVEDEMLSQKTFTKWDSPMATPYFDYNTLTDFMEVFTWIWDKSFDWETYMQDRTTNIEKAIEFVYEKYPVFMGWPFDSLFVNDAKEGGLHSLYYNYSYMDEFKRYKLKHADIKLRDMSISPLFEGFKYLNKDKFYMFWMVSFSLGLFAWMALNPEYSNYIYVDSWDLEYRYRSNQKKMLLFYKLKFVLPHWYGKHWESFWINGGMWHMSLKSNYSVAPFISNYYEYFIGSENYVNIFDIYKYDWNRGLKIFKYLYCELYIFKNIVIKALINFWMSELDRLDMSFFMHWIGRFSYADVRGYDSLYEVTGFKSKWWYNIFEWHYKKNHEPFIFERDHYIGDIFNLNILFPQYVDGLDFIKKNNWGNYMYDYMFNLNETTHFDNLGDLVDVQKVDYSTPAEVWSLDSMYIVVKDFFKNLVIVFFTLFVIRTIVVFMYDYIRIK